MEFNVDMDTYNNDGDSNAMYLIPDGDYVLTVKDVVPGESKKNRPQLRFRLDLAEKPQDWECNDRVYTTITLIPKGERGHGIAVHFLKVMGLMPDAAGNINFELDWFLERKVKGYIYSEKGTDGREYNRVNQFEAIDDYGVPVGQDTKTDDDVPF